METNYKNDTTFPTCMGFSKSSTSIKRKFHSTTGTFQKARNKPKKHPNVPTQGARKETIKKAKNNKNKRNK